MTRSDSQITRSDLNPELKKQIKLRTTAYPEFFIRSLMDHSVDVRTKMILHSAFSNETTVEVRELCLVRELKILDCFSVSNSDFDFLPLEKIDIFWYDPIGVRISNTLKFTRIDSS